MKPRLNNNDDSRIRLSELLYSTVIKTIKQLR